MSSSPDLGVRRTFDQLMLGYMDNTLAGVILDIKADQGDVVIAQVLDAYQNPVGEAERVLTNTEVEWLRERYGILKDRVRLSIEAQRILDANEEVLP